MLRDERSLILDVGVGVVFHTALLFSAFLLFAGHNAPGGGFVGGLVAGVAFVLRYVTGGAAELDSAVRRVRPEALLGAGVALAAATGAASWLGGGQFLESAKRTFDLPVLGAINATSALAFDAGVYLVVVGLVLAVLTSLGGEEEER